MTIAAIQSGLGAGLGALTLPLSPQPPAPSPESRAPSPESAEVRAAFNDFVGQTFFTQLLTEMRKTVEKPAYFHGGQTEEVFQAQMDQLLSEELTEASAEQFSGPMFELFLLRR
ncbi:MAG: rod-binding protein [Pirellulaceae bacterium]